MNTNTFLRDVQDKDAYLVEVQLKEGVPTAINYYDPKCGKTDLTGAGGGPGSASTSGSPPASGFDSITTPESTSASTSTSGFGTIIDSIETPGSGSGNVSTLGSMKSTATKSSISSILSNLSTSTTIQNKDLLKNMFSEYTTTQYNNGDYILVNLPDGSRIILIFDHVIQDNIILYNPNIVIKDIYTINKQYKTLNIKELDKKDEIGTTYPRISWGKIHSPVGEKFTDDGLTFIITKVEPIDKSLNITVDMIPLLSDDSSQGSIGDIDILTLIKPDEIANAIAAAEASSSGGKKRITRNRRRRRMRKSMRRFRSRAR